MIDLKISAKRDGTGDDDGMRLEELQNALSTIYVTEGAGPQTRLRIEVNRKGHVRSITGQIRADDDGGETATDPDAVDGQLELRDTAAEGEPETAAP